MQSIAIEESQQTLNKKGMTPANFAQNRSQIRRVMDRKSWKFFLICESCFWCASCCRKLVFEHEDPFRPQDIAIPYSSYPACETDGTVELLPLSFYESEKPSTGVSFL